jgi:hypothetical protein
MEDILVPFFIFASTGAVLWKFFDSRQKVRITALEKGGVDENMKFLFGTEASKPNRHGTLKWGLAAMFIGIALLISIPLQAFEWAQYHKGEMITGLIFTGGGLAFLIYYAVAAKKERHEG